MLNETKMILIDLDGTMVNTMPDLAYCVDEMLKQVGLRPHGEEKILHWIGNGVEHLIKQALIRSLNGNPDENLLKKAYSVFLDLYEKNFCQRSYLYPGVEEGIEWLQFQGYLLACVTNKASQYTIPLLKDLGIPDVFRIVISGDTLPQRKPDPTPLLYAAKHFHVMPGNALMIGDSISDVKAARAAGFHIICVDYGYNHGIDIHLARPDAVISNFTELFPNC